MRANVIRLKKRRVVVIPKPTGEGAPRFTPSGGVAPGELESEY